MHHAMQCYMHIEVTALLEHIDELLKHECLQYGFAAVCLI